MNFFVKDGSNGLGIDSAKVVVRKDSDNSIVFSGTTDSNGKVDLSLAVGVSHSVLAYKTGAYDGSRVTLINSGGSLYPASISLLKVSQRTLKVQTFQGDFSTVLGGATVDVRKADGTQFLAQTTGSDGKYQTNLQADLTGWKVNVTYPGLDGVTVPLDKIDLLGTLKVVFNPTIGSDE